MGKSKEIRKRTLLERLASERATAQEKEKVLIGAINKLRAALVVYAKGENWVNKRREHKFFSGFFSDVPEYSWVGEGNPEDLAKVTIAAVFGKDHPLTGEVVEPQHEKE